MDGSHSSEFIKSARTPGQPQPVTLRCRPPPSPKAGQIGSEMKCGSDQQFAPHCRPCSEGSLVRRRDSTSEAVSHSLGIEPLCSADSPLPAVTLSHHFLRATPSRYLFLAQPRSSRRPQAMPDVSNPSCCWCRPFSRLQWTYSTGTRACSERVESLGVFKWQRM